MHITDTYAIYSLCLMDVDFKFFCKGKCYCTHLNFTALCYNNMVTVVKQCLFSHMSFLQQERIASTYSASICFKEYSFKEYIYNAFVLSYLKVEVTEREGETERDDFFPPLVHFPSGWTSQSRTSLKLGSRSISQISHVDAGA